MAKSKKPLSERLADLSDSVRAIDFPLSCKLRTAAIEAEDLELQLAEAKEGLKAEAKALVES